MSNTTTKENRNDFQFTLLKHCLELPPISIETLWVNITRICNQTCNHCHVAASPERTEQMSRSTMDCCLELLAQYEQIRNLDITGGAPELHPDFDYFVIEAKKLNKHVLVRHNLTVILDGNPRTGEQKGYLPEFFAEHNVEIIASLPHYTKDFTDNVRGKGVFNKSIEGIRQLNDLGYGKEDTGLVLNLVYNADGTVLPSDRVNIEAKYKQELSRYGLVFNKLFAVTNMPINRFNSLLHKSETYNEYMDSLSTAFSVEAAKEIVCRSLISVGYDGRLYDCDFNQMLDMQIGEHEPMTVFNFDLESVLNRQILFGPHCFGCTAGGGSS